MNNSKDIYFQGIEIVKKSGKRITNSSVAKAVGKDPSAIKSSRPEMIDLINAISDAEKIRILKETPFNNEKRKKEEYRDQVIKLEGLLREAYGREVMLIREMDILEKENKQLNEKFEKDGLNRYSVNNIL